MSFVGYNSSNVRGLSAHANRDRELKQIIFDDLDNRLKYFLANAGTGGVNESFTNWYLENATLGLQAVNQGAGTVVIDYTSPKTALPYFADFNNWTDVIPYKCDVSDPANLTITNTPWSIDDLNIFRLDTTNNTVSKGLCVIYGVLGYKGGTKTSDGLTYDVIETFYALGDFNKSANIWTSPVGDDDRGVFVSTAEYVTVHEYLVP